MKVYMRFADASKEETRKYTTHNLEVLNKLKSKYKIYQSEEKVSPEILEKYDLVYSCEDKSNCKEYYVYKAPEELTKDEIALCMNSFMRFGYSYYFGTYIFRK